MNINIYLEEALGKNLNESAKRYGKSRNAIIREAIKEWLVSHETKQWPTSIMNFKGLADVPSFEASRTELLPPSEDPFA